MGTWLGGSEESWFNFEKLSKYRKNKKPKKKSSPKFRGEYNVFYLISVDVGRLNDQTVACIFRVNIKDNKYFATSKFLVVLGLQGRNKKPFLASSS